MYNTKNFIIIVSILFSIIGVAIWRLSPEPTMSIPNTTNKDNTTKDNTTNKDNIIQKPMQLTKRPKPSPTLLLPSVMPSSTAMTNVVERLDDNDLISSTKESYYCVLYFNTQKMYSYGLSQKTPSASVIKVFIMQYLYSLMEQGVISANNKLKGQSINSLIRDMIQKSDNSATNLLIDEFGLAEINKYVKSQGYIDTVLERKMLDFDARKSGLDNYTSLNDVMTFLKNLYNNKTTYPFNEMLDILKGQTIKTKIPSLLPPGTIVANKTGELEDVENDIGIVFTQNTDFAIAVLTNNSKNVSDTRTAISKLAKEAFEQAEKQ